MKKLSLMPILILLSINLVSATYFSEIMYDPSSLYDEKEYIELVTSEDLTGYTIYDYSSSDNLTKIKNSTNNIALIVEEGFNISEIDANIYSVKGKIGSGLNNDEDTIILASGNQIIDFVHYYDNWGGKEGKALCKLDEYSQWEECAPTPGTDNKLYEESNFNLKISEFLPDPQGYDDASMPNGEWIEIYNPSEDNINLEQFYLKDENNAKLIISNSNTEKTTIDSKDYLVVYTNGRSGFLNNEGFEKIYFYDDQDRLIDKVSYSDSKEGLSISKVNNNWVNTKPSPGERNFDENEGKNSTIKVERLYLGNDDVARFGQTIRTRIQVYKGDSTKEDIKVYLEKDSEKLSLLTHFTIENKFYDTSVTVPIVLPGNCNKKLEPGKYKVVAEGLDTKDSESLTIQDQPEQECKKEVVSKITESKSTESIQTKENAQESSQEEIIYESQSEKSKKAAIIIFGIVIILGITNLLLKKIDKV